MNRLAILKAIMAEKRLNNATVAQQCGVTEADVAQWLDPSPAAQNTTPIPKVYLEQLSGKSIRELVAEGGAS